MSNQNLTVLGVPDATTSLDAEKINDLQAPTEASSSLVFCCVQSTTRQTLPFRLYTALILRA
jgi:hypothetical protein